MTTITNQNQVCVNERLLNGEWNIHHNALFLTIYDELRADKGKSSAKQIDALLMNPDILIPFQESSIKDIHDQFKKFSKSKGLEEPIKRKFIDITNQLYECSLRNSSISKVLSDLNDQLDTFRATLSRDLQQETNSIKQEVGLVIQKLRSIDIDKLDLPSVQASLATLHQLTVRFSPILELKKCSMKDDNTRIRDLALAYQKRRSKHDQFPRMISDYPAIVQQVEKLEPVFASISETIDEIKELSAPLYKRQAELAQPPEHSRIKEKVLIPFGQVVYPVAAQCVWQIFLNSALKGNDPNLVALFESGQLAVPVPKKLDLSYFNQLWTAYFADPELENLGFEEWMELVLMESEPESLSLFCDELQKQSKAVNEIIETSDLTKLEKEHISQSYCNTMTNITENLFQQLTFQNQRNLAEVHAFLLSKRLK